MPLFSRGYSQGGQVQYRCMVQIRLPLIIYRFQGRLAPYGRNKFLFLFC